jgi:hypothetical protein
MGSCNCGHLAQTVTGYTKEQVQSLALERGGDWSEQSAGYCEGTGLALEDIMDAMLRIGLTTEDVAALERLSDPAIVECAGRPLDFKRREDAVTYLEAWADLLQDALLPSLPMPEASETALV